MKKRKKQLYHMSQKKCRGCKMKITKRQLKRIIKEEKQQLLSETGDQVDQNLKAYQDGIFGGDFADLEPRMEDAIYSALDMFMQVNGVNEAEGSQLVIDYVKEILGMP